MPQPKELDERMTINIQSSKKKQLQAIAGEECISDSKLLLKIVDAWLLERRNLANGYHRESNGLTNNIS